MLRFSRTWGRAHDLRGKVPVSTPDFENVEDVYPLTPMQQGMLFHSLTDPTASVFVNQMTIRLNGSLDPSALRTASEKLLARHSILRTAFLWDGLDQPLQVVREQVDLEWTNYDWQSLSESDQERRLSTYLEQDRQRGFDLADAPLTRVAIVQSSPDSWLWVWTTHHLIADGWSMRVMLSELFADLRGDGRAQEAFRFRDFVALQASRDEVADEAYWRPLLTGFASPHRLDVPGLGSSGTGHDSHSVSLDAATSAAVREFAREQRVTLSTVFLGSWAIVLSRWMRTRDVVFGVTSAGREASLSGVEDAVGLFINTLPVRIDVAPSGRLGDWLRSLQAQQLASRPFELSSLPAVQRWSDVAPGDPLFESIYVFENLPAADEAMSGQGLEIAGTDFTEHSNYPLAVLVHPEDRIEVQFIYDRTRLAEEAIDALATQMVELVGQYGDGADTALAKLDLVADADRSRLTVWEIGPELAGDDRLIHEIIGEVAAQDPDAVAAIFEDETISYGDLVQAAGTVAARLQAAGVGPNTLVGLLLPRSINMLIGMLGILQAGSAYVPLDPGYPESHLGMLMDNDGIAIVVTDSENRYRVPASTGIVSISDDSPVPATPDAVRPGPDDYAYVIHTSGSTGRPKGVGVTHRNLVSSTGARGEHYGAPVDRFLLLSSFAFDSSVVGLFWTLYTGGALVLPSTGREHDADHLLELADDHKVTHLLALPSLYQVLLDSDAGGHMSHLRVAIVAGEACPPDLLGAHLETVPGAELHNEYGPTEATVWCTVHRATPADVTRSLPIGRPIAGSRIYVLDDYGNRVPPGFVGEVAVAGRGLTPGYLNRPDLTAERFLTVNIDGIAERIYRTGDLGCFAPEGELVFLGRADTQLKIRGHRIEPGAVEAVIQAQPMVEAVAVAGGSRPGGRGKQLVAFVVGVEVDETQLRDDLREALPRSMVPDVIIPLESMPRLPNGKTDYERLPTLAAADLAPAAVTPPRNDSEARMAVLWGDLLGVDASMIGADSDYFALGGDSLLAIRLMSAVHRDFGTTVPLSALLDAPRLGDFCERIHDGEVQASVLVPIRGDGGNTVFMIHPGGGNVLTYEPLARHLPASFRSVGVQAHGIDGIGEPDRTVEAMGLRYAAAIDAFMPSGSIHLLGHSTGGLVAFETARALDAMGRTVGLVALLDTLYPIGDSARDRISRQVEVVRRGRWRGLRTVGFWYWSTLRGMAGRLRHGPKWAYLLSKGRSLPPVLAGKRINHIALRAQREYRPQRFPGTVTYIRAAGDEERRIQSSAEMWESVAGAVVVRDALGRHTGPDSMVVDPNAKTVAEIIVDELQTITAR